MWQPILQSALTQLVYLTLLKTESLDNAILELGLA